LIFSSIALLALGWLGIGHYEELGGEGSPLLRKQWIWSLTGVLGGVFTVFLPTRSLRHNAVWIYSFAVGLLMCVYAFEAVNGAQRWIRLGPIGFQPSQFAKLATILLLAQLLTNPRHPPGKRVILSLLAITLLPAALIALEPDLATALLFFPMLGCMLLATPRIPLHQSGGLLGLIILASPLVWGFMSLEQRSRVTSLFDQVRPGEEITSDQWQLFHAKRLLLHGTAMSFPSDHQEKKNDSLTSAERNLPGGANDFIFCLLVHRLGMPGALSILLLFSVMLICGFSIARQASRPFNRLLVVGLISLIGLEAILHLSVNTGLLPVTGISLPLVSYGGSGLLASCLAIGMIVRAALPSSP
jgi:cell division protein FtsW (lipid II flippase)